jgi:hypothetical protein
VNRTDSIALFAKLDSLLQDASKAQKQSRGQQFELVLNGLARDEGLDPRTRYRPDGEEIDGSFVLDGRTILLEAKWHTSPLPASSLYAFQGKVDGKLVGTVGVVISMSGFSDKAADALTIGKSLNVVLLDGDDFRACLSKPPGIAGVMRTKLRAAAEEGVVYLPWRTVEFASRRRRAGSELAVEADSPSATAIADQSDLICVVEGAIDQVILDTLAKRLIAQPTARLRVQFVVAHGRTTLPRVANVLASLTESAGRVLFVADADGDPAGTQRAIRDGYSGPDPRVIVVEPTLEAWLFPDQIDPRAALRAASSASSTSTIETAKALALSLDLVLLERRRSEFAEFADLIRTLHRAV